MHDLKWVRANPDAFKAALASRGSHFSEDIDFLLRFDALHRQAMTDLQQVDSERNKIAAEIGRLKRQGAAQQDIDELALEASRLAGRREAMAEAVSERAEVVRDALLKLPNIPADDVPVGDDETGNVELRRWGDGLIRRGSQLKDHVELGTALGGMDFETAAKVSGSRFVYLSGEVARLERALGQFMLDMHTEDFGYREVSPPLLVRSSAMQGTGQLPKFADDLFKTTDDRWLIPTAEVSLTNMLLDTTVDEMVLNRYCALTPCFRAEAGSAGRDTRGLIRQHQFYKVELMSFVSDHEAVVPLEFDRTVACVEHVLQALGLPYRVVLLCAGDMGFSARKTVDIEVWMPSQNCYREISSVSYFGDFQGRRMNARYRPAGEKGLKFVHTINGSGVAVGRALAAILENFQDDDGSVTLPYVLRPYMDRPMRHPEETLKIGAKFGDPEYTGA